MRFSAVALLLLLAPAVVLASPSSHVLSVSLTGLTQLGSDYRYEGWLKEEGEAPISTGVFDVGADGSYTGEFDIEIDNEVYTDFILTIEPFPDTDPAPAATKVFSGVIDTTLTTEQDISAFGEFALNDDFSTAAGSFILATPTGDMTPYQYGIWWLANGAASLTLPTLPAGWTYEGWVVGADGPISTGTFTDVAAADSNGGGPLAGPNAGPNFPGEDFITTPRDLTDNHMAVISIEPVPDNDAAPFAFKPLVDTEITDPGMGGVSQDMAQNLASFGSGSVRFGEDDNSSAASVRAGTMAVVAVCAAVLAGHIF